MTYNEALQLLELKSGFTKEELNKNYKRLMRRWHPDICNATNAEEMMKKLNEAKEILSEKNNNNDNNENNDDTMVQDTQDYTATRTTDNTGFLGTDTNTWLWIAIIVAAAIIIGIVWYYATQNNDR